MANQVPEQGQLVEVRSRHYVVLDVDEHADNDAVSRKVRLECLDDDAPGDELEVVWEREVGAMVHDTSRLPRPDGFDALRRFLAYTSALRWSSNSVIAGPPLTAPFYGAVEIEHYQLVPVVRALRMHRVSLLLADDVGLGKTIEAGLVAQELIRRHRARRIMVVCPASLQRQWQEEMRAKFNLDFHILDRAEAERLRREYGIHVNPWRSHPRLITSMDFLKAERWLELFRRSLQEQRHPGLREWDLLIVDEAHNCAPSGRQHYVRDSDRTRMLRAITDDFENRLFLTATPHNGFTPSFTALLEMLDPLRFSRGTELNHAARDFVMIRRLKSQILTELGARRFAHREVEALADLHLSADERRAHDLLDAYIESRLQRVESDRQWATQFALVILKKRLLSSPAAFYQSLATHVATLAEQDCRGDQALAQRMKERAEQDFDDDREKAEVEAAALQEATRLFAGLTAEERGWLDELIAIADRRRAAADTKAQALLDWIEEHLRDGDAWNDERLLVFTEYLDTLQYLQGLFEQRGWSERVEVMSGGMSLGDRQRVNERFQTSPTEEPVRILLGTDAASEGLNLQKHCRYLVHYEIPWNPNRMEQRNGRIDRHGQPADVVWCYHFLYDQEEDRRFLEVIVDKVRTQREDLGPVGDVIAEEVERAMLGLTREIADTSQRTRVVDEELPRDLELRQRIHEVREAIDQTRSDWGLTPEQMARVLDEALQLAGGQPMEPVEAGGLAGRAWRIQRLPDTWRDLNRYLLNTRGERLHVTFDHTLARDRIDVTLLHLGHPIMQRAIGLFRSCLWEQLSPDRPSLQRCTYAIVPGSVTASPALIAFGRLVAVSAEGRVLHEELLTLGGSISERDLLPLDHKSVQRLLDAAHEHRPIPRGLADRLRALFPAHEQQISARFEDLQAEQERSLAAALDEKAAEARTQTRELIDQRIREIDARLRQVDAERAAAQRRLFDLEELDQLEDDLRWLERRREQLRSNRATEPEAAARRFALRSVRVFPAGLLYVLPESLIEGAR
ncbi:MAG: DISARM system SNF2-like helicase DrmD [Armatimonadota bacterium]